MDEMILNENRQKTELVLKNVYNLPAISGAMQEVSRLLDDPSTNTDSLSKTIGKDQGLATKILSIANSPLYGLSRKVTTIEFAILIIGFQDIKNIVIALSMVESFKGKTDKYFNQKTFWLHSIITANAARKMALDLGYRIGGEAFIAGLLHDLSIPVIHKYFHSHFLKIVALVEGTGISFEEAEKQELGYSHSEIGSLLVEKWNLAETLKENILYHHKPSASNKENVITAIIHLADYMTQHFKIGDFYWDEGMELDETILPTLKFDSREKLDEFIEGYRELFEQESQSLII